MVAAQKGYSTFFVEHRYSMFILFYRFELRTYGIIYIFKDVNNTNEYCCRETVLSFYFLILQNA